MDLFPSLLPFPLSPLFSSSHGVFPCVFLSTLLPPFPPNNTVATQPPPTARRPLLPCCYSPLFCSPSLLLHRSGFFNAKSVKTFVIPTLIRAPPLCSSASSLPIVLLNVAVRLPRWHVASTHLCMDLTCQQVSSTRRLVVLPHSRVTLPDCGLPSSFAAATVLWCFVVFIYLFIYCVFPPTFFVLFYLICVVWVTVSLHLSKLIY
jgi:hypothetical protein